MNNLFRLFQFLLVVLALVGLLTCPEMALAVDTDGDGVDDALDNCPAISNMDQMDTDVDGIGDACDLDKDNDTIVNVSDNCPLVFNHLQEDADFDGIGDACDPDRDNDGVPNVSDNCLLIANAVQTNTDGDSFGDACDEDRDGDGVLNSYDNCPLVSNLLQLDSDSDGTGDVCDAASAGLAVASLDFGSAILNAQSPPQTTTFKNSGTGAVTISTIVTSGAGSGDFTNFGTCVNGKIIAAASTCSVQMVFTPSVIGGRNATVTVTSDASGSPHALTLTGSGIAAVLADPVPAAFSFADVTQVPINSVVTSGTITVSGTSVVAVVEVTGGEYSMNGGVYTTADGLANSGDTFTLRHTSSGLPGTAVHTILTIGGISDTFTSTTVMPDGDLDGGGVSSTDADRARRIAAGIITPSANDLAHGDVAPLVNGKPQPDGVIDVGDVVVIEKRSLLQVNW